MDIRLKYTNPATGEGDAAQTLYLSEPLHVEKEKSISNLDEFGTETFSKEIITIDCSQFQLKRNRIITVKMDLYNKAVIAKLVAGGAFEYFDATEQTLLESLQEPKQVSLGKGEK